MIFFLERYKLQDFYDLSKLQDKIMIKNISKSTSDTISSILIEFYICVLHLALKYNAHFTRHYHLIYGEDLTKYNLLVTFYMNFFLSRLQATEYRSCLL